MTKESSRASKHKIWRKVRWIRRIVQILFWSVFVLLILATSSLSGSAVSADEISRVHFPVEAFLDIDPLLGIIVGLSSWSVPGPLIFCLIILASSMFFGKFFCGWICPMGAMNHAAGEFMPSKLGKQRMKANRTRPYQKIKYGVLAAVLTAALFGSAIGGLLDPIAMATRGLSLTILPWLEWMLGGTIERAAASNVTVLQHFSNGLFDVSSGVLLHKRGLLVGSGVLISISFILILALNRWIPRFWCRSLCPLGALLGVVGKFGILEVIKDEKACIKCGKCQLHCSGAASPMPGEKWQRAECDLCMNCVADCPTDALKIGLTSGLSEHQELPNIKRRTLLASAALGAVTVPVLRIGGLSTVEGRPDPDCIRPPGSVEETDFLKRCIRCGQCMKICPNNALHPALDEAGIEGLWTPILVARTGYCEPTCTLCTQVCPTAAIRTVTEDEKTGKNGAEMVRIGTAFFDRGRCLPWAMGVPCTVCEEFCPTTPKAIWTKEVEQEVRGKIVKLKLPYMNPALCTGCGACEFVCPVHDKAAVRISCSGESRSSNSQLLLDYMGDKNTKEKTP